MTIKLPMDIIKYTKDELKEMVYGDGSENTTNKNIASLILQFLNVWNVLSSKIDKNDRLEFQQLLINKLDFIK